MNACIFDSKLDIIRIEEMNRFKCRAQKSLSGPCGLDQEHTPPSNPDLVQYLQIMPVQ